VSCCAARPTREMRGQSMPARHTHMAHTHMAHTHTHTWHTHSGIWGWGEWHGKSSGGERGMELLWTTRLRMADAVQRGGWPMQCSEEHGSVQCTYGRVQYGKRGRAWKAQRSTEECRRVHQRVHQRVQWPPAAPTAGAAAATSLLRWGWQSRCASLSPTRTH